MSTKSANEVFGELVKRGPIGGQYAVLPETTWYALFKDYLALFPSSTFTDTQPLLVEALKIISRSPHENAWEQLEDFLIKHIDDLTGWSKSWRKEDAERRGIFRQKDGNYYYHDAEGTLIQIIGTATLPETHLDFITDSIMRGYGPVRNILGLFALFATAEDFRSNREQYPRSILLVIPESYPMLPAHWHRTHFQNVRTVQWRPRDIYCDPGWLAEQVLARVTDNLDRDFHTEHVERFIQRENQLDADCPYQLDFVLDSGLEIGRQDEIYFRFEDKTIRWINGTPEGRAILSIGCKTLTDNVRETEIVDRLLSALVWSHRVPIRKGFGVGGARRSLPLTWGPRMSGGMRTSPEYILLDHIPAPSEGRNLALALYKEGKNADSVFYQFLNYWKIIEAAVREKDKRWEWVNNSASRLTIDRERLSEITASHSNIAEYFDYSGRCAIAHVFKRPFVNPDANEDYTRISKDVRLVEELARLAIKDFLPK
jgi:hypothetical protein